jgi:single-strand DNA-binding protein
MNKVILVGNISTDIELKQVNNSFIAKFSIAINRQKDGVDFIPIVVWNKQAENIKKYCNKGSKILVEGRIQTRSYDDNNGSKRYVTEVVAENTEFLGTKKDNNSSVTYNGTGNDPIGKQGENGNPYENMSFRTMAQTNKQFEITEEDLPW